MAQERDMPWHCRDHAARWLQALEVEGNKSIGPGSARTAGEMDETPAEASAAEPAA